MSQRNIFGDSPAPERTYPLKGGGSITLSALEKAGLETQKEVMEFWFYSDYEDPVHSCPYNSKEGGLSIYLRRPV